MREVLYESPPSDKQRIAELEQRLAASEAARIAAETELAETHRSWGLRQD